MPLILKKYMLFDSVERTAPPAAPRAQQQQDTIEENKKKRTSTKPKSKPKAKPTTEKPTEESEATTLRLTPTHYSSKEPAEVVDLANIDTFNLSHDDYYNAAQGRNRVKHTTTKALVTHATPACKLSLVPTHLTTEQLQNFHRPHHQMPIGQPIRITTVTKDRHANGKSKKALTRVESVMKHKSDLSGREGRIIFTEYLEERPPLVENVGMGTRICNFYRKKSPDDTPILSVRSFLCVCLCLQKL